MADVSAKTILSAIKAFLDFAQKLEELIDPGEKSLIEDAIIEFLRKLVEKLGGE